MTVAILQEALVQVENQNDIYIDYGFKRIKISKEWWGNTEKEGIFL